MRKEADEGRGLFYALVAESGFVLCHIQNAKAWAYVSFYRSTVASHNIFAGISLEVCAAFPAMTAVARGLDAYVAVDASGTFNETKRLMGVLRMQQASVILSDYATLMVEALKDNGRPEAGEVYGALDMPWVSS